MAVLIYPHRTPRLLNYENSYRTNISFGPHIFVRLDTKTAPSFTAIGVHALCECWRRRRKWRDSWHTHYDDIVTHAGVPRGRNTSHPANSGCGQVLFIGTIPLACQSFERTSVWKGKLYFGGAESILKNVPFRLHTYYWLGC